jgi:hypothetical protein
VHVEDSKDLYGDGCTADSLQKTVLNAIKKSNGREEDFISVLEALSNETLSTKNIACCAWHDGSWAPENSLQ